jgi:hypothetical protein
LKQANLHGFGVLQFNAVVSTNIHARHLYERLGFIPLGTIPKGFRMKDGHYEDICPYYRFYLEKSDNRPKRVRKKTVKNDFRWGDES